MDLRGQERRLSTSLFPATREADGLVPGGGMQVTRHAQTRCASWRQHLLHSGDLDMVGERKRKVLKPQVSDLSF